MKWEIDNSCNICKRAEPDGESWGEEHVTFTGFSGFNFKFCPECTKNEEARNEYIFKTRDDWRAYCQKIREGQEEESPKPKKKWWQII